MSEHKANLRWERGDATFTYEQYPRDHEVVFGGGTTLRASAAPEYFGHSEHANPEELLIAALSSCHMLTFLAVAAKRRLVVERYEDAAVGILEKNADGKLAITRVVLHPKVTWGGEPPPSETLMRIHESAHRGCFIANSVKAEVRVEPASSP